MVKLKLVGGYMCWMFTREHPVFVIIDKCFLIIFNIKWKKYLNFESLQYHGYNQWVGI